MTPRRFSVVLTVLALTTALLVLAGPPAVGDHTTEPVSVAVVGSLQDELGCPGDWQPECAATELAQDAEDGVWRSTFSVPALASSPPKVALVRFDEEGLMTVNGRSFLAGS